MNILLTGGAGYIGSHTAVALVQAGFFVAFMPSGRSSLATMAVTEGYEDYREASVER